MSLGNYSTPKNEKGNESNSYGECRVPTSWNFWGRGVPNYGVISKYF